MGAFSDNKENGPVCERVNERPLTESEPHAAALRENQALQAAFQPTYYFRADQGDGPLFLDEEHGLLRIGEDGWVLEGKALRSFRISEDGAPLFESGIGTLKCTVSDVPDQVNVMAAEIARFHLERQKFERWEAMDGLHRAGTESSEERRERERTNDLRRPRFDVPAPVREFRVELTLDHPYRTVFDARIAAPAFDRNYPRAEDYLKSYREQDRGAASAGRKADAHDRPRRGGDPERLWLGAFHADGAQPDAADESVPLLMPGPAAVAAEVDRAKTNTLGDTKPRALCLHSARVRLSAENETSTCRKTQFSDRKGIRAKPAR